MDFQLTPEQQQFREAVLAFSNKHLAPGARARAQGRLPMGRGEAHGEAGAARHHACGSRRRAGREPHGRRHRHRDRCLGLPAQRGCCPGNFGPIRVLAEYGSDVQKKKFPQPSPDWRGHLGRHDRARSGPAVTDLKTTATPDGDGFRINGSKIFTTHSAYAELILAYVRFGPGVGGIGSVLIETKAPGVRRGKPSTFMSGEEWAELHFDNVRVPAEMVLLREGGFKKQMAGFNVERIGNAARSLALGRYASRARAWALERRQFGRLLAEFQGLQWKFADMKMQLDAAQLLLYRAAVNADRGLPSAEERPRSPRLTATAPASTSPTRRSR